MTKVQVLSTVVVAGLLASAADAATPPAYRIQDLGTFGGELSLAREVNANGDACGQAESPEPGFYTLAAFWPADGDITQIEAWSGPFGTAIAYGLNDHGHVVGNAMAPSVIGSGYMPKAFFWSESTGRLDLGLDPWSVGVDINNAGQVCGFQMGTGGGPFHWTQAGGATFFSLGAGMDPIGNEPAAINENGVIVGQATNADGEVVGYTFDISTGTPTLLARLHDPGTGETDPGCVAYGINDTGLVVGASSDLVTLSDVEEMIAYAVYWTSPLDIHVIPRLSRPLWAVHGEAQDINNNGWIVGRDQPTVIAGGASYGVAWLYVDGEKWALNDLVLDTGSDVWDITSAYGINDAGQIVGQGQFNGLPGRAFLMTPVQACPGDTDDNGVVNVDDLLTVITGWGGSGAGDTDGNGVVNVDDLLAVITGWGPCDGFEQGACCMPVGTCDDVAELECNLAGGSWNGSGSECAGVTCDAAPAGDLVENAFAIPALPYQDTGDTSLFDNNYHWFCDNYGTTTDAPDAVYAYQPQADETVTISMCRGTAFNSKLYVYENVRGNVVACSERACSTPAFPELGLVARIDSLQMLAGSTYYIVVDGAGFASGFYTLDVVAGDAAACCLGDGSCVMVSEQTCTEMLGGWNDGVDCLSHTCPAAPLTCCEYDGTCSDVSESDCDAAGTSAWQGVGTDCASASCPVLPAGDVMENAITINSLPYAHDGDTTGYRHDYDGVIVDEYGYGPCPFASVARDVVYTHTSAADVWVEISLCRDSAYDTKLYLYDATDGEIDACSESGCSTPSFPDEWVSRIDYALLTAGHTYYIFVDGFNTVAYGPYTLDVTVFDAGACCLPEGGCEELAQADCAARSGVWYDGQPCVAVDCTADFPTGACCLPSEIWFWGECLDDVTEGFCAARSPFASFHEGQSCILDTPCPMGACCYDGEFCGDDTLWIDCDADGGVFMGVGSSCSDPEMHCPANDTVATAQVIAVLPYFAWSTTEPVLDSGALYYAGARDDYFEECPDTPEWKWGWTGAPDLVYAYTPAADVTVTISMCNQSTAGMWTNYDSKLYVYEDVVGNVLACNDNACQTPVYEIDRISRIDGVTLLGGHTYYIVVDGFSTGSGIFTLSIMETP